MSLLVFRGRIGRKLPFLCPSERKNSAFCCCFCTVSITEISEYFKIAFGVSLLEVPLNYLDQEIASLEKKMETIQVHSYEPE